jgi:hypothetical protein
VELNTGYMKIDSLRYTEDESAQAEADTKLLADIDYGKIFAIEPEVIDAAILTDLLPRSSIDHPSKVDIELASPCIISPTDGECLEGSSLGLSGLFHLCCIANDTPEL